MNYTFDTLNLVYSSSNLFEHELISELKIINVIDSIVNILKIEFPKIKLSVYNRFEDEEFHIIIHDEQIYSNKVFEELLVKFKKDFLWRKGFFNVHFAYESEPINASNIVLFKTKHNTLSNINFSTQDNNSFSVDGLPAEAA